MSRIVTAIDCILDAIIAPALWRIHRAAIAAHERVTGRVPLTPENLARAMGVRLGGEDVPPVTKAPTTGGAPVYVCPGSLETVSVDVGGWIRCAMCEGQWCIGMGDAAETPQHIPGGYAIEFVRGGDA